MIEPDFRGKRVTVTGGAGFIGSHLVDALVARWAEVTVLDNLFSGTLENLAGVRDRIRFVEGDIRDLDACRAAIDGAAHVFHLAAIGSVPRSMKDPATTLDVNARGTANVFTACRDAAVRSVVFASSSSVYGDSEKLPKVEGEEGRPLSPYALSKRMGEELAELYWRVFGLPVVSLRFFNVYGPRQNPEGPYAAVIPKFLAAARDGRPLTIYGDGEQARDFTYVADVVGVILAAASAPPAAYGQPLNSGRSSSTTVRVLANSILHVSGSASAVEHLPPRAGDIRHSSASAVLLEVVLGVVLATELPEGLRRTWNALASPQPAEPPPAPPALASPVPRD
ncbi:NAD-dependent epimerase/dehydratase family protein [Acidobacteria bacterium ACD]|nr:MAG: NAD-dependent epimerase/dehydratase family protein [Acidobacteriota bacterium]MCE7956313.1 NAD-dependent epimerase/dehydratase family protein [Acidobacteria bacterium ACB2]MDL1948376.1 NAD-dependent epimerase/dehydratase family protein [Acidobacteria bacterium ACD]